MSKRRELRSYEYVNHPYTAVRDALTQNPQRIFQSATRAAATRADDLAAALKVRIAGIDVGADIDITAGTSREEPAHARAPIKTVLPVEWKAANRPGLFPSMKGQLEVYPLTATETQLDFSGEYDPPLGMVGEAVDAMVGHRIAEASVQRFVADIGVYLRGALG
jgi:hypothetical protein